MSKLKYFSVMSLAVLAGMLFPGLAFAGDAPAIEWPKGWAPQSTAKYPPYPDVWGRMSPAPKGAYMNTNIYNAGGADPMVTYYWSDPEFDGDGKLRAQEFFSGRMWQPFLLNGEEEVRPRGHINNPEITTTPFSDGSYLHDDLPLNIERKQGDLIYMRYESFVRCLIPGHSLVLKDKNNQDVWRRFIVSIREKPQQETYSRRYCGAIPEGSEILGFSVSVNLRAQFGSYGYNSLFMLKDDTFLAVPEEGFSNPSSKPFVIRFDQNMRSPFLKDRTDLYVIDMVELEPLLEDAFRQMAQTHANSFEYFDNLLVEYLKDRGHRH